MKGEAIDPIPFWRDFRGYSFSFFRKDFIAALSVALLALPQSMAYAFVADLPTSAGIFSAIFGTLFTAAFGASRKLVSGTTNVIAILIQSGTAEILHTYYPGVSGGARDQLVLQIVLQLTLLIGLFQILGGLLKLGRLTQFASRSVVVGYISGAAFAIIVSQSFYFFGIGEISGSEPTYRQLWFLLSHIQSLHVPTTLLGLAALALLFYLWRLFPKFPYAAIVLAIATLVVFFFGLSDETSRGAFDVNQGESVEKITLLKDVGLVYTDFPKIVSPIFDIGLMIQLVPFAFAITLLSVLEGTSIGRLYAKRRDRPYLDNQEVYGLGMSNFLSSFFGAMPSSGSFSRSALNVQAGAQTRFAAMMSGLLLFGAVVVLGPVVTQIPLPALAALLFFTAYTMVNLKHLFLCLKATRTDAFVVAATFAGSLVFSLNVALYVGVIFSVVLYLKEAAIPHLTEYTFNSAGKLRPIDEEDKRLDPSICIVHAEGELFFGAADLLQSKLLEVAEDEKVRAIILQMMNTRRVDASICLALMDLGKDLEQAEKRLYLSGVTKDVMQVFAESGLLKKLGKAYFFEANEQLPSEPTRNAYTAAKAFLINANEGTLKA